MMSFSIQLLPACADPATQEFGVSEMDLESGLVLLSNVFF